MNPLERAIARERAKLLRIERNGASEITRTYRVAAERMRREIEAITALIEEARREGVEVKPVWLLRQARYQRLLVQLEEHTLVFLRATTATIERAKRNGIAAAEEAAPKLTLAALGTAPRVAQRAVLDSFSTLPGEALESLVMLAGDSGPLGQLLAEIAPDVVQGARDALSYGIAAGRPVRDIARDLQRVTDLPRSRALTISRTEVLRAYREASQESFRSSPAVAKWRWQAALDTRTCPMCWAMSGTEHPLSEPLASHPNCRCSAVPVTTSWEELGFEGIPDRRPTLPVGSEAFAALSEGDKLAILGQRRLDAYEAGDITLEDLVRPTHSRRWGKGRRTATLIELSV